MCSMHTHARSHSQVGQYTIVSTIDRQIKGLNKELERMQESRGANRIKSEIPTSTMR